MLGLFYMMANLDRSNIGNANTAGLQEDLGLVGNQFGTATTLLYEPLALKSRYILITTDDVFFQTATQLMFPLKDQLPCFSQSLGLSHCYQHALSAGELQLLEWVCSRGSKLSVWMLTFLSFHSKLARAVCMSATDRPFRSWINPLY